MSAGEQTVIRRLGPGDEDVVRKLADDEPQTGLLADDATIFLAAFCGAEPVSLWHASDSLQAPHPWPRPKLAQPQFPAALISLQP